MQESVKQRMYFHTQIGQSRGDIGDRGHWETGKRRETGGMVGDGGRQGRW